jgi:hypothetical protein
MTSFYFHPAIKKKLKSLVKNNSSKDAYRSVNFFLTSMTRISAQMDPTNPLSLKPWEWATELFNKKGEAGIGITLQHDLYTHLLALQTEGKRFSKSVPLRNLARLYTRETDPVQKKEIKRLLAKKHALAAFVEEVLTDKKKKKHKTSKLLIKNFNCTSKDLMRIQDAIIAYDKDDERIMNPLNGLVLEKILTHLESEGCHLKLD